ncbi:hypothetical protein ADK67_03850 [Saccharothrix sp. NRRL B-16348]|nr:hypothetical protein ADK67_03850 [Saccharothrix sp. NRRL B-16348]
MQQCREERSVGGGEPWTDARILMVDDDARIRELLESTLRFAGFDVTVAGSGWACLELVRLRSRQVHVPVVFLTARTGHLGGHADRGLRAGHLDARRDGGGR